MECLCNTFYYFESWSTWISYIFCRVCRNITVCDVMVAGRYFES